MRRVWALACALIPAACVDLSTLSNTDPDAASAEGGAMPSSDGGAGASDVAAKPGDEGGLDGSARPDAMTGPGCRGLVDCTRFVFVTRSTFLGSLGGVAGADAKCQAAAIASTYPMLRGRVFQAWLSAPPTSAVNHLVHGTQPYVRPDNLPIAKDWGELVSGHLGVSLSIDEQGFATSGGVWTGTNQDGNPSLTNTCSDWGTIAAGELGQAGTTTSALAGWTDNGTMACDVSLHLYCIEQ